MLRRTFVRSCVICQTFGGIKPPSSTTSNTTTTTPPSRRPPGLDLAFRLNAPQRCFDVDLHVDFIVGAGGKKSSSSTATNTAVAGHSFATVQVPFVFLSDHSITNCEVSTLQRHVPVDYETEQHHYEFSDFVMVNYVQRLVFFRRSLAADLQQEQEQEQQKNNNKKASSSNSKTNEENSDSWLAVPLESFLQLVAAQHGVRRRDVTATSRLYDALVKALKWSSFRAKVDKRLANSLSSSSPNGELWRQLVDSPTMTVKTFAVPKSVKKFILNEPRRSLTEMRTAAGLTPGHLQLAVSKWMENFAAISSSSSSSNSQHEHHRQLPRNISFGPSLSVRPVHEESICKVWKRAEMESAQRDDDAVVVVKDVFSRQIRETVESFLNNNANNNNDNDKNLENEQKEKLHEAITNSAAYRNRKTREVVECIERYGFCVVQDPVLALGVPFSASVSVADEPTGLPSAGLIAELAANAADPASQRVVARRNSVDLLMRYLFGVIMNSHYGLTPIWGKMDAPPSADIDHLDTAYLDCAIDFHTDATYIYHPPRLQGFGLIHRDETLSRGGANILVDGFAVAQHLFENHPREFASLALNTVPCYYAKDGKGSAGFRPVILTSRRSTTTTATRGGGGDAGGGGDTEKKEDEVVVNQISFNDYDRAPLVVCDPGKSKEEARENMEQLYKSLSLFNRIMMKNEKGGEENNKNQKLFSFRLQPQIGHILIFDNYRCLHSRTAFSGPRIMCGSYVSEADFNSVSHAFVLKSAK